jgi:cytochrome P450
LQTAIREHRKDPQILSIEDIYQETVSFFFGGNDTSAHVLLMALYEISENAELQERVKSEIEAVVPNLE